MNAFFSLLQRYSVHIIAVVAITSTLVLVEATPKNALTSDSIFTDDFNRAIIVRFSPFGEMIIQNETVQDCKNGPKYTFLTENALKQFGVFVSRRNRLYSVKSLSDGSTEVIRLLCTES